MRSLTTDGHRTTRMDSEPGEAGAAVCVPGPAADEVAGGAGLGAVPWMFGVLWNERTGREF